MLGPGEWGKASLLSKFSIVNSSKVHAYAPTSFFFKKEQT
jgi:hypothetical protein